MELNRLTGPNAGSLKYDILTAISLAGLNGTPGFQTSMQRLGLVLTARYNWRREELSIGQRDMAKMWGVNERTAKREVKRWLEAKLLVCTRPGVRGRVAAYRLNLVAVFDVSKPFWSLVGPDYEERMALLNPVQSATVVQVDFAAREKPEPAGVTHTATPRSWAAVVSRLKSLHPTKFANWIGQLSYVREEGQAYVLRAESAFAARYVESHLMKEIVEAVEVEIGPMRRIVIES
jgi:hypothetical protein